MAPPEETLSPADPVSPMGPAENAEDGASQNTGAAPPLPGPAHIAQAFYGGPGKSREKNPAPKDPPPARTGQEPEQGPAQITEELKYVGRIRDAENRERLYIKDARTGDLIAVDAEGTNEGKYRLLENTPDTLILAAENLVYLLKKEHP
jgi:hypothetical protein